MFSHCFNIDSYPSLYYNVYYRGGCMISVRLSKELKAKLEALAKQENMTKSDVVKEALSQYIIGHEKKQTPYELGKDLFGQHGSGQHDLAKSYKQKVRDKINAKNSY